MWHRKIFQWFKSDSVVYFSYHWLTILIKTMIKCFCTNFSKVIFLISHIMFCTCDVVGLYTNSWRWKVLSCFIYRAWLMKLQRVLFIFQLKRSIVQSVRWIWIYGFLGVFVAIRFDIRLNYIEKSTYWIIIFQVIW